MGDPRYKRMQATLFVSSEAGLLIDEIRAQWDPTMAARIHAHATVMRRVTDPDTIVRLLANATTTRTCRLSVGGPRWAEPREESGIYLAVRDPYGDLAALRAAIAPAAAAEAGTEAFPHVTLLHPRTTSPEQRARAWESLRLSSLSFDVEIAVLSLVAETDDGWNEIASFSLDSGILGPGDPLEQRKRRSDHGEGDR